MPEHILKLQAPQDSYLYLWFEPWAEGLGFPAGSVIELRAESAVPGKLQVDETPERTAVFGWAGSTLKVLVNNVEVISFDQPVPNGMTPGIIEMLFGQPPVPGPEDKPPAVRRPWWRFWQK